VLAHGNVLAVLADGDHEGNGVSTTGPLPRSKRPSEQQRHTLQHLSRHEFLFYKGYLQGADLRKLGQTYLAPGILPSAAVATIRDHLVMLAHRAGRIQDQRLLRIQLPSAEPTDPATGAGPSPLETYRAQKDPDGSFYSEAELIALYRADFPQTRQLARRTQRNVRLRERQLAALATVERLWVLDPTRSDAVDAWFEPVLASRLHAGNIVTIDQLIDRVQSHGHGWWSGIPRLGVKGAARITDWLARQAIALGMDYVPEAIKPRGSRDLSSLRATLDHATDIVPIERFVSPADLDGHDGWNRAQRDRNLTGVDNDYAAIQQWLNARATSADTKRSYRKEAERLLLWAILERRKPLSSLIVEDCIAYRDWLAALGRTEVETWPWHLPQSAWIGPRSTERLSPEWRPFDGPLKLISQRHARVVVQSFFQWLTDQCYLLANPWKGVAREVAVLAHGGVGAGDDDDPIDQELLEAHTSSTDIRDRTLSQAQWLTVLGFVAALPDGLARERLQFIFMLAYGTGLRASELVSALTGHLRRYDTGEGETYDMLVVRGKGRRIRSVPMPPPVMTALSAYLVKRGLNPNPYALPNTTRMIGLLRAKKVSQAEKARRAALRETGLPIATSTDKHEPGLTREALYRLLKDCFAGMAAQLAEHGQPDDARKLAAASTHWLRHTCGSHAVAAGASIQTVQHNLGHASVNTTTIYMTQAVETRFEEMRRFMQKWEHPV
jgi:site-specific recombinase XerD